MLRVSVALATHNGGRFIRSQLASILAQTVLPDQIVVSDDASTDDTLEIVHDMLGAAALPGVRVPELTMLENPVALGVTGNFEQAARAATGDLIVLCDQDDLWHLGRIERIVNEFTRRASLLLVHEDARLIDENDESLGMTLFDALEVSQEERRLIHDGVAFRAYLRRNLATGATVSFRRDLLDVAAPFPRSWVHDEWLAIVAAATGEVDLLESPMLDYRQHGRNEIGARKLSLSGKVGRLLEPRTERNRRLLVNAEVLTIRLAGIEPPVPDLIRRLAKSKLAHERMRSRLPAARLRRIAPVLHGVRSGSYSTYGRGAVDAVRDLLQPAR